MSDLREMFFQECDDLLEGLSTEMSALESGSASDDSVNAMFRAVHSIKGGAGAFGLDQLVTFAHAFENVLDELRSGELSLDDNILALMFSASDHLGDLIEAGRNEDNLPDGQGASILSDLKLLAQSVSGPGTASEEEVDVPDFQPLALDLGEDLPALGAPAPPDRFVIRLAPRAELFCNGHDPALLLRGLQELGDVSACADLSSVGPLSDHDWQSPVTSWTITFTPDEGVDGAAIREVFEFVEGSCALDIEAETTAELPGLPPLPDPPPDRSAGAQDLRDSAAAEQVAAPAEPRKPVPSAPPKSGQSNRSNTIRVELQRVDRLINLVGELVISEAMLRQSMNEMPQSSNSAVDEAMSQLKQLSGVIQESVMAIRAQPVRSLFQRMSRIVREASREAGKSARLVTVGDATELDKTVTERLVEPLTHMVRNAIDHGLERPDDRIAAGKDERGSVTLEAAHRSGRVVITLRDDGAGINRPRVRQIAEEKGLVRPEDDLTDADIDNLLFRPGFSTASEVSSLSGRGVGMDVVRNEIQALGGRVTLHSEPGKGTTVSISLPLTLAVLEGMVITVADQSLVVPTLALRETLRPGQANIHAFCDAEQVLSRNDELIPIVDLGTALRYRDAPADIGAQSLLIIEGEAGRRIALAVDGIVDQREVVIKGLEQNYRQIPGIAAATILGDGKIALIVDTDQMISMPGPPGAEPLARTETTGVPHHV